MADKMELTLHNGTIPANSVYKNRKSGFSVLYIKNAEMKKAYPAGGYSVVGQIGAGREAVGTLLSAGGNSETVYKVQKMPHTSVAGYVQVGEQSFVAVVKDILAALILAGIAAALILAGIAAGIVFLASQPEEPAPTPDAAGVIDAGAELGEGEVSVPVKTETKGKQIKINGIAQMQLKAGQTAQEYVFSNPSENPCYFKIEIEMRDTGEILYTSDLIPPGYHISSFTLNRALDAGEYDVTVHFLCYSFDEEQRPLNNMDIKTTIVAS